MPRALECRDCGSQFALACLRAEPAGRGGGRDGRNNPRRPTDLLGAKLVKANLSRANLSRALMVRVDLTGADLRDAILRGAVLHLASLYGVRTWRAPTSAMPT